MRSAAWRLRVHDRVSHRPHVDRQPRASDLRRHKRNPERADCLFFVRSPTMNTYEHQALVVDYNNTAAPYPDDRTIVDLFVGQVKATPDDEAIRFGGDALTYSELHDRSDRFSAHLQSAGVR